MGGDRLLAQRSLSPFARGPASESSGAAGQGPAPLGLCLRAEVGGPKGEGEFLTSICLRICCFYFPLLALKGTDHY